MIELEAGLPTGEIRSAAESPFAVIWRYMFGGIFSNIGRIAALASCRNLESGDYRNSALAQHLEDKEADRCMRLVHELLWNDWIRGSLEQQHADLLLYSLDISASIVDVQLDWIESLPFLALVPVSATPGARLLFASNLELLIKLLKTRRSLNEAANAPEERRTLAAVLDQAVCSVRERYSDPNLSLKTLSQALNVSERHLGRLLKELLGQTFRQHLRNLRISEAARLLADTDDDVKMIAGRVGYSDPSHFGRDFRTLVGCTPLEFRSKQKREPMSDLSYRKSVLSY